MKFRKSEPKAFSLNAYRSLLQTGRKSGYNFITFSELAETPYRDGRLCLLRHDVDASVAFALRMAQVESELGISSTYFVMLRSPAYNLLGRHAALAVREMVRLGHDIGLHFDAEHPLCSRENLTDMVHAEAEIIAQLAGAEVRAISFHQPTAYILDNDLNIPGLINTYNRVQLADWHYVSDSNRKWKAQAAEALLEECMHPRVQLLIHPMWWVCDQPATEEVWDQAVLNAFDVMQQQFLDTEAAYGAKRELVIKR